MDLARRRADGEVPTPPGGGGTGRIDLSIAAKPIGQGFDPAEMKRPRIGASSLVIPRAACYIKRFQAAFFHRL